MKVTEGLVMRLQEVWRRKNSFVFADLVKETLCLLWRVCTEAVEGPCSIHSLLALFIAQWVVHSCPASL